MSEQTYGYNHELDEEEVHSFEEPDEGDAVCDVCELPVEDCICVEISDDWRERVRQEVNALQEKIHSMQAFLQTSQYADLPQNAKDLLQTQSNYMTGYAEILAKRLSLAEDRAE